MSINPDGTLVHLLGNPAAGQGAAAGHLRQVTEALVAAGASVETVEAESRADAQVALADIAAHAQRVVVAGGDGMVHLAVQELAGTDAVLGVIPIGSGNDFAGALGLPTEVVPAAHAALHEPVSLDLLRIGDTWAASIATVGFSAAVNARANRMRRPRGSLRYTIATLLELPRLETLALDLELDGAPRRLDATVVTVANTSDFGGGMRISPDADPADGIADLTIVEPVGRLELLWFFRKVFGGTHMEHPKVSSARASTVRISNPGVDIWADGEPVGRSPVTIEVVPNALRLAGIVRA